MGNWKPPASNWENLRKSTENTTNNEVWKRLSGAFFPSEDGTFLWGLLDFGSVHQVNSWDRAAAISRFLWPQIWSEEALELVKICQDMVYCNRFQEWSQLFSLWFCSFERCQNHSPCPTRLSDAGHGYMISQQWFRFFRVKPKLVPFNGQVQLVGDSLFATCCIASTVHVHVPYTNSLDTLL